MDALTIQSEGKKVITITNIINLQQYYTDLRTLYKKMQVSLFFFVNLKMQVNKN